MADAGFFIDGSPIPAPIKCQIVDQPVTTAYSGKQTLDGTMHNSVIRMRRVITLQFGLLSGDDVRALRTAFAKNKVSLKYPEATTGGTETGDFIPGQATRPMKIVRNGMTYWSGMQIKLTEV